MLQVSLKGARDKTQPQFQMTQQDVADLYLKFRQPLKNFIAKRVSDPFAVEDLVHDVFVRIHTGIGTLKESDKLTAWVYQTARNSVIDFYRKRKHPATEMTDDLLITALEEIPDAAAKLAPVVRGMIQQLPEKYRETLVQADFDGRKHADIARDLGISVSAVKSRVQRARQMLKTLLLNCCHFEFDMYGTVFDFSAKNCERCCSKSTAEPVCSVEC